MEVPRKKPGRRWRFAPAWLRGNADDRLGFERLNCCLQDALRCQPFSAGAFELIGRNFLRDLFEKPVDAVSKSVLEIAHAAEDGVGVDGFLEVAGGVERQLAPHVFQDESAA